MTKQEIEAYINTYRVYPVEYTGKKNLSLLKRLNASIRYDLDSNTITRLEGRINEEGNFEIVGLVKSPIDDLSNKVSVERHDLNMEAIIETYNNIVFDLGYPNSMIKDSGETSKWNLRDMVAELDYIRSTYVCGGPRSYLRFENKKQFENETFRLYHFIRKYKKYIDNMDAYARHNSKYDRGGKR